MCGQPLPGYDVDPTDCEQSDRIRTCESFAYPLEPADAVDGPPLYICLCNALTDRTLKQAATATGSARPGEIYAACGCRAQCGKCVQAVLDLVRDHASQAAEQLQGAD
jgi:bacterioferritin-associated ferredoxin